MGTEINRKLATIQRVSKIENHPNADRLDIATVLGWEVIVKRDEFKVNDLGIFFEIDAFLPVRPEFEFLRKNCFKSTTNLGDGFRLKTSKLRGIVSQGLLMPLGEFCELDHPTKGYTDNVFEGSDLTEILHVQKYDKPIPANLVGKVKGRFPSFLYKTDQERIQNIWNKLNTEHLNKTWEVTTKLNGSSMTIYCKKEEQSFFTKVKNWILRKPIGWKYGVCSRNLELKMEDNDNAFVRTALKYQSRIMAYCKDFGVELAFQAELCGSGIQKNAEQLKEIGMFVFDVYDITRREYINGHERREICSDICLNQVPLIDVEASLQQFNGDIKNIIAMADNTKGMNVPHAEGLVWKCNENPELSFKVISPNYLLKHDE